MSEKPSRTYVINQHFYKITLNKKPALLITLLFLFLFNTARADLPDLGDPTLSSFSSKEEQAIGESFYRAIRSSLDLVDDQLLNDYLKSLGNRLASHSDAAKNRFHFFIIKSSAINAFAGPAAYIGVNSGLIIQAENESQLAGVMAHEIAHVSQRHIARAVDSSGNSAAATFATIVAAILLGSRDPEAGQAVLATGIAGAQQASLNFTRDNEYEADRVGIGILASAGINPEGMVEFFQILLSKNRGDGLEYLRTHPLSTNRITEARHRLSEDYTDLPQNSIDFKLFQARLSVLIADYPEKIVALKRNKNNLISEYQRALALMAINKHGRAIRILEVISKKNNHPWLQLALAEAYEDNKQISKALRVLKQLTSLYPDNVAITTTYAKILLSDNQASESIEMLQSLLQTSDDAILHKLLAKAYYTEGDITAALESTGNHYLRQGYYELALKQYENALQQPDINTSTEKRLNARIIEIEDRVKSAHRE